MSGMITGSGKVGLILMGGGARAAYQAGVLDGLREILEQTGWPAERNPYQIICGTSAGAINAAVLAAGCDDPGSAVRLMTETWSGLRAGDVYRTDLRGAMGNAARWLGALTMGWLVRSRPRSLFDNAPLVALLQRMFDPGRLAGNLERGLLSALAVTASSYTSGRHVTYYQGTRAPEPWTRTQRLARPATITVDHLLASSAIPFVFPAVPLALDGRHEFFGDGSMRQLSPISPAIHLGADHVLVIGAGQLEPGGSTPARADSPLHSQYLYPSLAQVGGHALSSIFLDSLAYDVERLTRINGTLRLIPPEDRARTPLRPIEVLAITPSRRLDSLAAGLSGALPRTIRTILQMTGATERRSAALLSYLLFEPVYTMQLVELGRIDARARRPEVLSFFGLREPRPAPAAQGGGAGDAA